MMNLMQACIVVAKKREANSLLVATMGAMMALDRIEESNEGKQLEAPLVSRLSSVPLMGGASGIGLGLALGQPQRHVIVVDGDASLLMELSSLVTVAEAKPSRYLHIVINNRSQFTGLANLDAPATQFSFSEAASNAGYKYVTRIESAKEWDDQFTDLTKREGPTFVELAVEPVAQAASHGFVQAEMPDRQFERMGQEAAAMKALLSVQE